MPGGWHATPALSLAWIGALMSTDYLTAARRVAVKKQLYEYYR